MLGNFSLYRMVSWFICGIFFSQFLFVFAGSDGEKTKEKFKGPVIGIDLGTTYSCVAIYRNDGVEIIADENGNRITPSYVAFTEDDRTLVGMQAKDYALINPERTYFAVKRLIGRRWNDPTVDQDRKILPYPIVERNGSVGIRVPKGKNMETWAPEQISALVLKHMKSLAENYLGETVHGAVITVPAYFNDEQRRATKDAGTIAGLNVLRMVNEPTAAALAYGLDRVKRDGEDRNVLVYDLGGGTFDVSLLTLDEGVFEVLATAGDTHLGGEDFDQNLMNEVLRIVDTDYKYDLRKRKVELQALRSACEKAKRQLSVDTEVKINLEEVSKELSDEIIITRATFERLNMKLFKSTLEPIRNVMKEAKMSKSNIHEIVFVGGSTRIPAIRKLVREFFDNKEPSTQAVNPDEAVAVGAAIQAGTLAGVNKQEMVLLDVTALTLGIRTAGDLMTKIIPRSSSIPIKKSQEFTTFDDNQTQVLIEVFEGEREKASENRLLDKFVLNDIPPAPRKVPRINVEFSVDENGQLTVRARDMGTQNEQFLTVSRQSSNLSEAEIQKMVRDAELHREEDELFRKTHEARSELETYIYSIEKQLKDRKRLDGLLTSDEISSLESAVSEANSKLGSIQNGTPEDYRDVKLALDSVASPLMAKLYQSRGAPGSNSYESSDEL